MAKIMSQTMAQDKQEVDEMVVELRCYAAAYSRAKPSLSARKLGA